MPLSEVKKQKLREFAAKMNITEEEKIQKMIEASEKIHETLAKIREQAKNNQEN